MPKRPEILLWLSDSRGSYIPRDFALSFTDRAKHVTGVSAEDWENLEAGPDDECYWEVWDQVCEWAEVIDDNGVRYSVYQDDDCWLVPKGMEWSDEANFFVWPDHED